MVCVAMTQSSIKSPKPRVILFALLHLKYNSLTWEPVSHHHCKRAKKYVTVCLNSDSPDISLSQRTSCVPAGILYSDHIIHPAPVFWGGGKDCFHFLAKVKGWQRHVLANKAGSKRNRNRFPDPLPSLQQSFLLELSQTGPGIEHQRITSWRQGWGPQGFLLFSFFHYYKSFSKPRPQNLLCSFHQSHPPFISATACSPTITIIHLEPWWTPPRCSSPLLWPLWSILTIAARWREEHSPASDHELLLDITIFWPLVCFTVKPITSLRTSKLTVVDSILLLVVWGHTCHPQRRHT